MSAFLWTMVALGFLEVIYTAYCGLSGKVPVRTPKSMAWNSVLMLGLALWALVLLMSRAAS